MHVRMQIPYTRLRLRPALIIEPYVHRLHCTETDTPTTATALVDRRAVTDCMVHGTYYY